MYLSIFKTETHHDHILLDYASQKRGIKWRLKSRLAFERYRLPHFSVERYNRNKFMKIKRKQATQVNSQMPKIELDTVNWTTVYVNFSKLIFRFANLTFNPRNLTEENHDRTIDQMLNHVMKIWINSCKS